MATPRRRLVNDCIYGMIGIPACVQPVVATSAFQRLSRIKQLGTLQTAWPSAVHTRFEHSLGTMHLANLYAAKLELDPDVVPTFLLASLLHDVAHGPFSHLFEHAIAGTPSETKYVDHDEFRCLLLTQDNALCKAVGGPAAADRIIAVWRGGDTKSTLPTTTIKLLHTLLAGVAGVDRMDYILRDSYHTTPQRCIDRTCIQGLMEETIANVAEGRVEYTPKGERYLSHFLEERCYLYREVYSHKRAMAADYVLGQAFHGGLEPLIRPCIEDVTKFERLDEAYVLQFAWSDAAPRQVQDNLRSFLRGTQPRLVRYDLDAVASGGEPFVPAEGDLSFFKRGLNPDEIRLEDIGCREGNGALRPLRFNRNAAIYDVNLRFRWEQKAL